MHGSLQYVQELRGFRGQPRFLECEDSVRFRRARPAPPEFNADCSQSALSFLRFPRPTRGSGRFCVCHAIQGDPDTCDVSPPFGCSPLSVL